MSEITVIYIVSIIQIILAAGLVNVWLVRFNKKTKYRGRGASSMESEFSAYGLPRWFMYLIGVAKLGIAILLLVGLWRPFIVPEVILALSILMIGAISMHIKVKDPFVRFIPALCMLALCVTALVLIALI